MINELKDNITFLPTMEQLEPYMHRCLQLAQHGESYVAPNPMVGAVLVSDEIIIGEGYHQRYGQPHAEPNAINSVTDKGLLRNATLFVSLEPCSHYGKTPPCADLIVKSGIPRVVIGTLDPNPKVAGKGVEILRKAGVDVFVGVLENECRNINKRFFIFQEQKRPYILLKWAQTQDGFMDRKRMDVNEPPLIISNEITKQLTHKMRSENQAIMVSTNTVLLDNPTLTVRNWSGKSPIRIAIDRVGRIPAHYNLLDGSMATLIFTENKSQKHKNLEFINIAFDDNCLSTILKVLYERNINSLLVEGGAKLLTSFIQAGLWDEANIEVSPQLISEGIAVPIFPFQPILRRVFDNHEWMFYQNLKPVVV